MKSRLIDVTPTAEFNGRASSLQHIDWFKDICERYATTNTVTYARVTSMLFDSPYTVYLAAVEGLRADRNQFRNTAFMLERELEGILDEGA